MPVKRKAKASIPARRVKKMSENNSPLYRALSRKKVILPRRMTNRPLSIARSIPAVISNSSEKKIRAAKKETKRVRISVIVPISHADEMRKVLAEAGAGRIGNYDFCSFTTSGVGRFRGDSEARPFLGLPGRVELVREEKIEVSAPESIWQKIVAAARRAHPYEEPVIEVILVIGS